MWKKAVKYLYIFIGKKPPSKTSFVESWKKLILDSRTPINKGLKNESFHFTKNNGWYSCRYNLFKINTSKGVYKCIVYFFWVSLYELVTWKSMLFFFELMITRQKNDPYSIYQAIYQLRRTVRVTGDREILQSSRLREILQRMASKGHQVMITTHPTLLSPTISNINVWRKQNSTETMWFGQPTPGNATRSFGGKKESECGKNTKNPLYSRVEGLWCCGYGRLQKALGTFYMTDFLIFFLTVGISEKDNNLITWLFIWTKKHNSSQNIFHFKALFFYYNIYWILKMSSSGSSKYSSEIIVHQLFSGCTCIKITVVENGLKTTIL